MAAAPASCMSTDNGCVMFDCLVHLWEWIDPPIQQTQYQMDNKKNPAMQQPLSQHHLLAHHVHPDQIYSQQQLSNHCTTTQPIQNQPNGVIHHQLVQNQYHANMNARSPLLENRHEMYGTSHNQEYARLYGANDNYNYQQSPSTERSEQILHTDHNVNHDIQNIPKGYNAEVYQDYLKRNPPKDSNQIYQNHQPMYRPNVNQYCSKPYLPYTNRIGPQSNTELLKRQYNEIQQMKMQQQLHYQSQAQIHQQQKFAERQLLLQQIHGVQPPPNLQNSIYSDSSYGDLNKYGSRNDFKEYTGTDIHKDIDKYAKNNEYRETESQIKQQQDIEWQYNQEFANREIERYKVHNDREATKSRSPPSDFNNQLHKNVPMSPLKSSESSSPSIKSPSSESRRSSSGQALRSPTAQRIPSAPVTTSGMLYKQGSDGLKVWRKRWFVLSEYCLYYYKSQDEEKLLGSVLLPSYKVSACTSEDKVMRKFAFKLEHANMRTYVLAALDQESMLKWIKSLTMAALMQSFSDQIQRQKDRDTVKVEDDDEVPGPTYANAPPKPRRSNDGYNLPGSDIYDPNYDLLRKPPSHYNPSIVQNPYQTNFKTTPVNQQLPHTQHSVYQTKHLNELPKNPTISHNMDRPERNLDAITTYEPTQPYDARLNHQKTPEHNIFNQRSLQTNPFLQQYPAQEPRSSENNIQSNKIEDDKVNSNPTQSDIYLEPRSKVNNHVEKKPYSLDVYGELSTLRSLAASSGGSDKLAERRTPDAYSRASAINYYNKGKNGDYEDIYAPYANETDLPKLHTNKSPNISQRDNVSISSHAPSQKSNHQQSQEKVFTGPSVLRRKKMQASGLQPQMPRPHSADFLEYESKNEYLNKSLPARNISDTPNHPQRPKSSLDINSFYDPSSDTYYSEESYAEKMRQSAQYLQQTGAPRNIQIPLAKYASGLAEKQLTSPYTQATDNNNYETEFGGAHNRDNVSYTSKFSDNEVVNSNWMLKEKGMEPQKDYFNRSGSVMSDGSNASYIKEAHKLDPNSDGFMRSASARLPSATERDGEKKVQQREESMKRLLEWKQRMLQSPLTRKSTPATISLARSLNQSRQSLRSDQYKPKTHTNAPYNSYSSDDEEETPGTELQNTNEGQAGRSCIEDIKNTTALRPITPHLSVSTESTEKSIESIKSNVTNENAYENICVVPEIVDITEEDRKPSQLTEVDIKNEILINKDELKTTADTHKTIDDSANLLSIKNDGYETHDSESDSEIQLEYTDHDLDEVLLGSDIDEKPADNSHYSDKLENISSISETPPILKIGEDHYLPMSPRKMTSIESAHQIILDNLSVFDQTMPFMYEDNPYVEMNLGNEEDDTQTYELVCVSSDKPEPVYMELNNLRKYSETLNLQSDTASNFADTKDPTIKRMSKPDKLKEKGESSELDEECYKDVSLDTPFSRFSISDNFRPASYYLGNSTTMLTGPDDFETGQLSYPKVRHSSSSCEGLSDEALSRYILDKLDKSDISQDNSILKMLTSEKQNMNKIQKKATSLMIYGSKTSIHDTLTRGEKIRHSRANLANERNKLNEVEDTFSDYLNVSLLNSKRDSSDCIDSDSFRSCTVESSRLSLESENSGKFEQSNWSSDLNSLIESDSITNLKHSSPREMETLRRSQLILQDKYPQNSLKEKQNEDTDMLRTNTDVSPSFPETISRSTNIISHTRSSSTPVNCTTDKCFNPYLSSSSIRESHLGNQYKRLSDQASGYVGPESSCSSIGILNSPISFYTKNYTGETLTRKNLNKNNIKDFETEKTNIRSENNPTSTGFHSRDSSTEQSAPYYYSDLSSQEQINVFPMSHYLKNTNKHRKLNNQRRKGPCHKKNDISHIHNPIHANNYFQQNNSFELAAARSVSVEFLSVAEKDPEIDTKNIYESTGSKQSKIPESINLIPGLICKRNSNSTNQLEKTYLDNSGIQRGILNERVSTGSMSSHCSENSSTTVYYDAEAEASAYENVCIGEKQWDEDILWRNNLRRVSHRHARSMDDLDTMPEHSYPPNTEGLSSIKRVKKNTINKVSRNVTYVNCDIQAQLLRNLNNSFSPTNKINDENDVYVSLANEAEINQEKTDEGVYEQLSLEQSTNDSNRVINLEKNKKQFEIDREKLRQWDLMSSGLMKGGSGCVRGAVVNVGVNEAASAGYNKIEKTSNEASMTISANDTNKNNNQVNQQALSNKSFLGSNSSIGRSNREGNIPVRAVSPRVRWVEETNEQYNLQQMSTSQQHLNAMLATEEWSANRSPSRVSQQPVSAVSPRVRRHTDADDMQKDMQSRELGDVPTAGELLGRSHEELVLLLIQLRRRHAATHRSIEQCCVHITSVEECLGSLKAVEREESLRRLEQLKMQLMDLEQQYAKSKPLVQLVDNMVKLGSLYNRPGSTIERLERNQRLRHKVLAEHALEQQRWLESAAAGKPLETEAARVRVAELWALEQELADEASILQGLKTDKDAIDSLLTGVRHKVNGMKLDDMPVPGGGLEAELARVHAMLAHNSKKLEHTVAENARLERELQQLRRALRARRASAPLHQQPAHPSHTHHQAHPTAMLEDEVTRVQQLVSALQRQRQELSRAVRLLTQQSQALQTTQEAVPSNHQPTTNWQETNLDTGHTKEHGLDYEYDSQILPPGHCGHNVEPLYVDTRSPNDVTSPMSSQDMQHSAFSNLSNVEKQEIKTVRIVKRESERRQRGRERSLQPMSDWSTNNITANIDQFLEEELVQPLHNYRASSVPRTDYTKFEEYYAKQNTEPPYLRFDRNMELSPKYPSSPSLSNYDYSRDMSSLSSSYHKSYDRSPHDKMSISTQYLNSPTDSSRTLTNDPMSKTSSVVSLSRSNFELSPIFKSEAAKQIITEMSDTHKNGSLHRRQVPKEKRRHNTAPHHVSAKTLNELPREGHRHDSMARSVDDADMERALRGAAPDVVRSALPATKMPDSIDQLLAAPQKILIPERYIPEKPPELSPEEQQKRQEKVESIKKMLTSTSADPSKSPDGQEKRHREHLLQMNQILAKQVTEMSKIIAVKALEELPLQEIAEDSDRSPDVELPIYQQRENFFT